MLVLRSRVKLGVMMMANTCNSDDKVGEHNIGLEVKYLSAQNK